MKMEKLSRVKPALRQGATVAWRLLLGCGMLLAIAAVVPKAASGQVSMPAAARFLDQATFGATADDIQHVRKVGFAQWLTEQFQMPLPTDYLDMQTCPGDGTLHRCPFDPPSGCGGGTDCFRMNYTMHHLQQRFFRRALNSPDQLRQRVAFALNQIVVISALHDQLPRLNRMQPYVQTLEQDAFGNFRDLLYDITLNPGMGRYLDMVDNNRNNPNENYAREILQLFSIGLDKLDTGGQPLLDDQGNRKPTYTQEIVTNFARVFTGWIFAPFSPALSGYTNYIDPMYVSTSTETNRHDHNQKFLLNCNPDDGTPVDDYYPCTVLPMDQTAVQDLDQALNNIHNYPAVGPFIGKNLIQHLVTSNPSPEYVSRVTGAFNSGTFIDADSGQTFGGGTRGDLQAVIAAILLDPEARGEVAPNPTFGHLREPILWITTLLRTFNTGDLTTDYVLAEQFLPSDIRMDEDLYRSPTVFNFFPPDYQIPGENNLFGPEFAIQSTATSLARINFACDVIYHGAAPYTTCTTGTNGDRPRGTWIDENTLLSLPTDNPQTLVDTLNNQMMHGSMTPEMNSRVVSAVRDITDPDPTTQALKRAREAVYLIATSSEYNVER